jgi:hypothetical protein
MVDLDIAFQRDGQRVAGRGVSLIYLYSGSSNKKNKPLMPRSKIVPTRRGVQKLISDFNFWSERQREGLSANAQHLIISLLVVERDFPHPFPRPGQPLRNASRPTSKDLEKEIKA